MFGHELSFVGLHRYNFFQTKYEYFLIVYLPIQSTDANNSTTKTTTRLQMH